MTEKGQNTDMNLSKTKRCNLVPLGVRLTCQNVGIWGHFSHPRELETLQGAAR